MTRPVGVKTEFRPGSTSLWLDDVRPAPGRRWFRAKSVSEAIELVEEWFRQGHHFTEASLDHDLGGPLDGIAFVDWMAETGRWPVGRPVVHSMNPVGRIRMQATINRYWTNERCQKCRRNPEPHRAQAIDKGTGGWRCNRCGHWQGSPAEFA